MPPKNPQNRKECLPNLSVCVISLNDGTLLNDVDIWRIGSLVESISGHNGALEARADISVSFVNGIDLRVEVDCIPFKEHANIKSFPSSIVLSQRLASDLALNSTLELMPSHS